MACARLNWLPATGLLLLGGCGFAAAWILLGARYESLCTPMAVLAALDAVLLLHLARVQRGRVALAVLVTMGSALLAIGGLVTTRAGQALGLLPWESVQRLGFEPLWLIARMSLDRVDLAWLLAGVVVAVALSWRFRRGQRARR